MEEEWKPIPGYSGSYEVSSRGRVRSLPRLDSRGHRRSGGYLKPSPVGREPQHLRVTLHKNGVKECIYLHRVVALAFIPNPKGLPYVLHGDDDPGNNTAENLRWGTHQDNMNDMKNRSRHVSANSLKTHCKRGHPFSPDNTSLHGVRQSRSCKTCVRERQRKGFSSRREAQVEIEELFRREGVRPSQVNNSRLYQAFLKAVKRGEEWAVVIHRETDETPEIRLQARVDRLGYAPRPRSEDPEERRLYAAIGFHARKGEVWADRLLGRLATPAQT